MYMYVFGRQKNKFKNHHWTMNEVYTTLKNIVYFWTCVISLHRIPAYISLDTL